MYGPLPISLFESVDGVAKLIDGSTLGLWVEGDWEVVQGMGGIEVAMDRCSRQASWWELKAAVDRIGGFVWIDWKWVVMRDGIES